jgi:DNA-binding IclR family transcriptional regulator
MRARRAIGSVRRVAAILRAVAGAPSGLRLVEVARTCALDPGLAHRYLAALVDQALITRDPRSRAYRVVGSERTAHEREVQQPVVAFVDSARALQRRVGETLALLRWTSAGPQAIWVADSDAAVRLTTRLGVVLPLLTTSTGHVGIAFAPARDVEPLVAVELRRGAGRRARLSNRFDVEDLGRAVRRRGLARAAEFLPGVASISAPLRLPDGSFWGCATVLGLAAEIDVRWRGRCARALASWAGATSVPHGFDGLMPRYPLTPMDRPKRVRPGRRRE